MARESPTLPVVEEVLVQVEQVLGRGGEKYAGDVLRPCVVLHAQQVGGPAQVGLLIHLGMAAEDDVQAASARAALQHEQAQFLLLVDGRSGYCVHLVVAQMVDVHAHRLAQSRRAFEAPVLRRQAAIVELHQLALRRGHVRILLRMADQREIAHLRLAVSVSTVGLLGLHGLHHLVALLIIYYVYTHDSFFLLSLLFRQLFIEQGVDGVLRLVHDGMGDDHVLRAEKLQRQLQDVVLRPASAPVSELADQHAAALWFRPWHEVERPVAHLLAMAAMVLVAIVGFIVLIHNGIFFYPQMEGV